MVDILGLTGNSRKMPPPRLRDDFLEIEDPDRPRQGFKDQGKRMRRTPADPSPVRIGGDSLPVDQGTGVRGVAIQQEGAWPDPDARRIAWRATDVHDDRLGRTEVGCGAKLGSEARDDDRGRSRHAHHTLPTKSGGATGVSGPLVH